MYDKYEDEKFCQRWNNGKDSFKSTNDEKINIDRDGYFVRGIPKTQAASFVEGHHYSGSYPPSRFQAGLFRDSENGMHELCGVAGFTVPMSNNVVNRYAKGATVSGDKPTSIELGRFVLLDDVPHNGESWFLGKCFGNSGGLLKEAIPSIDTVLAFSDPIMRTNQNGKMVMPGHIGTIYQAHNGVYVGRSHKKTIRMTPKGTVLSARTLSKIRKEESGWKGGIKQMVSAGAEPRRIGETPLEYYNREIDNFPKVSHPGNHAYLWPIANKKERREAKSCFLPEQEYPKWTSEEYNRIQEMSKRKAITETILQQITL